MDPNTPGTQNPNPMPADQPMGGGTPGAPVTTPPAPANPMPTDPNAPADQPEQVNPEQPAPVTTPTDQPTTPTV